jgi:hypothetical protein
VTTYLRPPSVDLVAGARRCSSCLRLVRFVEWKDSSGVTVERHLTWLAGARSVKVVLDAAQDDALHFQNSRKYRIDWEFASANPEFLGGASTCEETQYHLPASDRRFLLGAVTYYQGPEVWALERAPYDTATPGKQLTPRLPIVTTDEFYSTRPEQAASPSPTIERSCGVLQLIGACPLSRLLHPSSVRDLTLGF